MLRNHDTVRNDTPPPHQLQLQSHHSSIQTPQPPLKQKTTRHFFFERWQRQPLRPELVVADQHLLPRPNQPTTLMQAPRILVSWSSSHSYPITSHQRPASGQSKNQYTSLNTRVLRTCLPHLIPGHREPSYQSRRPGFLELLADNNLRLKLRMPVHHSWNSLKSLLTYPRTREPSTTDVRQRSRHPQPEPQHTKFCDRLKHGHCIS